jgi:hypothetical protein
MGEPATGPQDTEAAHARDPYPNPRFCGGGTSADANTTSCPFAVNVYNAWVASPSNNIQAYSPVTSLWYTMPCDPNGAFMTCTGGVNASVSWPHYCMSGAGARGGARSRHVVAVVLGRTYA